MLLEVLLRWFIRLALWWKYRVRRAKPRKPSPQETEAWVRKQMQALDSIPPEDRERALRLLFFLSRESSKYRRRDA